MRPFLAALIVGLIVLGTTAIARDDGRYANSPLRDWFKSLRDKDGTSCCDEGDAAEVEMWDIVDGKYRVRIGGIWVDVPPEAVLNIPNKLGFARAWTYYRNGVIKIRCFLIGPLI
jgi:hypothetical protein